MKNMYFERLDVLHGQPFSLYLPLQVQPIVNGDNGEPRDIEAKDVENLHVYLRNVGETGRGKSIPFDTLYNYVIVKVPAQMRNGEMSIVIVGNYGQVCLRAEIVANIGNRGGLGGIIRPYVSPVVGNCGTIADIAPLPLCFTNNGKSPVGLGLNIRNDNGDGWKPNLEISLNGVDWVDFDENYGFKNPEEQNFPVNLAVGMSVYFRGMNPDGFNRSNDNYDSNKFVNFVWSNSDAAVSVDGDVASLINYEKRVSLPQDVANFTYLFGRYDSDIEAHSSLVDASGLVTIYTSYHSYDYMFSGCTGLVTAPALPATTLARGCYGGMFSGCTGLVTAPALPATTLARGCYGSMFFGCTSLATAPALPATTLESSCYGNMFSGCTSLATAPALPATTLESDCYNSMFYGCTSLATAPALPATTLAGYCYGSMFSGCTSLATAPALPATTLESNCYNSMFSGCTGLVTAPALPATTLESDCYNSMFYGCTSLATAPALPATTLAGNCYYSMFSGCTSLATAPALPATTLESDCYYSMFSGCTGLITAPALPATTLASNCYNRMFSGCTGLVTAPALPATTLAGNCYYRMFSGCTGLVTAPALPATTLAGNCYYSMFSGCTSLLFIEMLAVALSPTNAVTNWVKDVPTGKVGTFVKNAAATWTTTGNSGVPTGWGIIYKQV